MNILITNVYSYKNKGDAAIVISLIREVERVFEKPEILIQTTDAKNDKDKYGIPVSNTLLWILLSSVRNNNIIYRLMVLIGGLIGLTIYLLSFKLLHIKPYFVLTDDLRKFVNEAEQSDLVIACGGGYLNSANKSLHEMILLSVTCLNFLVPKCFGKTVCLYSQSIGPIHGNIQRRILRFALNKVDLIEPRENISMKVLKEMHLQTKLAETADTALLLGDCGKFPSGVVHLKSGRMHVGITVRKWFKRKGDFENYIEAVAGTIDYLIEVHNAEVFYVPQVIAENFDDDDRITAHMVRKHVNNQEYFKVIEADLHPFEVIGICGRMDIFIGTRMHSNIFALINHIPVVAIEYEHKTRGIMRGLGLEALTINISDVTLSSLKSKLDLLLDKRSQYIESINLNLPRQITKGRSAIEIIKEVYETKTNF